MVSLQSSHLKDAKKTSIVATQKGSIAHLRPKYSVFKSRCKNYLRGFSETLHNEKLTYWNAVVFLDSDVESGRDHWDFIETQDKSNRIEIYARKGARLHRSMHGWVNRSNQAPSYYSTARKKQNRELDSIVEMYALNNTHAVWINLPNLSREDNQHRVWT